MFELNADNALDYLRRQGWIDGPAEAEVLSGGVSNFVLRVTTPARRMVVKQSRPQLRTRDLWLSDLDRIWREQEVMQALHPFLPDVVPEVLHVDRENYVYAMSHAPLEAKVWKTELLAGKIDMEFGEKVGQVLGRIHRVSAEDAAFQAFRDHRVYVQLRVDPFYRRVLERWPDVALIIAPLIDGMLTIKEALCHGDYTPKNILVHPSPPSPAGRGVGGEGFTLVDYETAHFGDPTMDLGLFMAHLTLKAVRAGGQPALARRFFSLVDAFWRGYAEEMLGTTLFYEPRGVLHCGVCLLARVDGISPVDYISDTSQRETVRQLGRAILLEDMSTWEEVWQRCERELWPRK